MLLQVLLEVALLCEPTRTVGAGIWLNSTVSPGVVKEVPRTSERLVAALVLAHVDGDDVPVRVLLVIGDMIEIFHSGLLQI